MVLPPLCAVCDAEACERAGWHPVSFAAACLRAGARFLQLRAKTAPAAAMLEIAREIAVQASGHGSLLVVNDRADVARIAGAGGVHVGQDDLPPAAARTVMGEEAVIGFSTHTDEQVAAAVRQPVSYVAIGPVFATRTKATGYEPIGLEAVRRAAEACRAARLPLVAIGGITLERAPDVVAAGASSVAVIGDLLAGGDPERRVREYLAALSAVPPSAGSGIAGRPPGSAAETSRS
jgi:thiamine-phosphate pyrophosphorylase